MPLFYFYDYEKRIFHCDLLSDHILAIVGGFYSFIQCSIHILSFINAFFSVCTAVYCFGVLNKARGFLPPFLFIQPSMGISFVFMP